MRRMRPGVWYVPLRCRRTTVLRDRYKPAAPAVPAGVSAGRAWKACRNPVAGA